jgi:AcrR family transcriptional regulator
MTNRNVLELIGVTKDKVIETGLALIDRHGLDRFCIDQICKELAIQQGSVYKFFKSTNDFQNALTTNALAMLVDAHRGVDIHRVQRDAIEAHALVERAFGQAHPGLYVVALRAPLGARADIVLLRRTYMNIMMRMLRGYDLPDHLVPEVAQCLTAVLQGFVNAEIAGGRHPGP